MAKTAAPPFRADHVGSLLRPPALKEARQRHAEGALDAAGLAAVEDREIERVIEKQQELGLRGITDGELRRSWWHLDFLWGLDGIAEHQADFGIGFVGATPRTAGVRVDGKIGFSGHPMLEHYRFLQRTRRRRAEAHDSGAVGAAGKARAAADRRARLPAPRRAVRGFRRGLPSGRARVRGGGLPLSAARRGLHRDALRREVSRQDGRARRRSRRAAAPLRAR